MVRKLLDEQSAVIFSQFYSLRPPITRGGLWKLVFARLKTPVRADFITVRAGLANLHLIKTAPIPDSVASFKRLAASSILSA